MRFTLAISALALAACGLRPAKRPTPTFAIAAGHLPQALTIPAGAANDFAACPGAFAFVPVDGGVVTAGWHGWLVEPSQPAILGIACDEAQHLFTISRDALSSLDAGVQTPLASLPAGDWHVVSTVDARIWIWGRDDADGRWKIHQVRADGLLTVQDSAEVITAAAPVGNVGLVAAVGGALIAWSATGEASPLAIMPGVDGLAVAADGTVYVSLPDGVVSLKEIGGEPTTLAKGLHGPLRVRGDVLYVLSAEQHAVIRLSPSPQ